MHTHHLFKSFYVFVFNQFDNLVMVRKRTAGGFGHADSEGPEPLEFVHETRYSIKRISDFAA